MKRQIVTTMLLAALMSVPAQGEETTLAKVRISGVEVERAESRMKVAFELDVTGLELGKNGQVIYTPVLESADGSRRTELPKVVVSGRNIAILEDRNPKRRVEGALKRVRKETGREQKVSYAATERYLPWMSGAVLYLSEDLCGCGELESQSRVELKRVRLLPARLTAGALSYAEPEAEGQKVRRETGRASVDFEVNGVTVQADQGTNRAELAKIVSTLERVRKDGNVKITEIAIHGYASPEATYAHNTYLAESRTKAVVEYVKGLNGEIPSELYTVRSTPEDWEGVRSYVAGSTLPEREAILKLIDDGTLDPDAKDWRLKLRYPEAYAELLSKVYPKLRRTEYTVTYEVRPFTAEEALRVMQERPEQVSLQEMYAAARYAGLDTEAGRAALELAARTYPADATANRNAALAALGRGDAESALSYLSKMPRTGETEYLRGVIAYNGGDVESARNYMKRSAELGFAQALKALEEIGGGE